MPRAKGELKFQCSVANVPIYTGPAGSLFTLLPSKVAPGIEPNAKRSQKEESVRYVRETFRHYGSCDCLKRNRRCAPLELLYFCMLTARVALNVVVITTGPITVISRHKRVVSEKAPRGCPSNEQYVVAAPSCR